MHRTLHVSVLLITLLLEACATYRSSFGYAATDLSWLKPGMRRDEVVDRLGEPLQFYTLNHGSLAVYEYNQGYIPPMEKEPAARVVGIPFIFFVELATLGGLSYATVATADCHIAELRILYGTSGNVIAATECPGHPETETCEDPQTSRRPSTLPASFKGNDSVQLDCEYPMIIPNDPDSNNDIVREESTSLQHSVPVQFSKNDWDLYNDVGAYCPNADLGSADSQTYVGDLYYRGAYGLEKNLIHAYVWYSLAAKNGSSYAAKQLEKVLNELSPRELVKAQNRLEQWQPGQCKRDLMGEISINNE